MNLANSLTLFRIFLVPLLVVVLLTKFEGHLIFGVQKEFIGAGIFVLASLTDLLDGYLARRRRQVTTLGKLLDPVADKLLVGAAFVALVQMRLAPAWMVVVILGREFAVSGLRSVAQTKGITIPASSLGKLKMWLQVGTILLLILGQQFPQFVLVGRLGLWVVVVVALSSGIAYYRKFRRLMAPSLPMTAVGAPATTARQPESVAQSSSATPSHAQG